MGAEGVQGPQGAQGVQGEKGDKGDQGERGETGGLEVLDADPESPVFGQVWLLHIADSDVADEQFILKVQGDSKVFSVALS